MKEKSEDLPLKALSEPENISQSTARSRVSLKTEGIGQTLTKILTEAWVKGLWLQSQMFRDNPFVVAMAASEGYITTKGIGSDSYWDRWLITERGLAWLKENKRSV